MNFDMIWGLARHILTFGGGALVTGGWLTEGDLTTAVGAIGTLAGLAWSLYMKRKAKGS